MSSPAEYVEFAREIATDAGAITRRYFRTGLEIETKADETPVTRADREAEELLRRRIAERYPRHGILGEEYGHEAGSGEFTWILDPIDGTKSFVAGVPLYAVLVACVEGYYDPQGESELDADRILAGVIHLPALNETIFAARGYGAHWTRESTTACSVSAVSAIEQSRICTTDFADLARREPDLFARVSLARETRTWGDAYGYALVATGRAEAMIDPIMSPWDVGPLPVIIEEAGGSCTDLNGRRVLGSSVVATNGRVPLLVH
jgi:histidinol phosphatase-like enzyme (inositol monophosphatase family)